MTRPELLRLLVARARSNGFELRRWYTSRLNLPWISQDAALVLLETQRRYYALVFSHEFAQTFWKPGADITFDVPAHTFQRTMPDGTTRTVTRKPYIRRSARPNAWKYHLRQMALAEDPLRYLRKYLHIEEELSPETADQPSRGKRSSTALKTVPAKRRPARPLPPGPPTFLERPYRSGRS